MDEGNGLDFVRARYYLPSEGRFLTQDPSGVAGQVLIDGVAVCTFTPSGTSYATYTTASFTVTAGAHTVAFVGLDPDGGDNTALIDQVAISLIP